MTRKEITQKLDNLSQEVYAFGRECSDAFHTESNVEAASLLYVLGEFLKHTSFTMDSFGTQLETIE